MPSWFGDYNALCFSACIPLPTCNLLRNENPHASSSSSALLDQCLPPGSSPIRDLGTTIISILGIVFIMKQVLYKSHRMFQAVGRAEMSLLFLTYTCILLLQIFTIGGIIPRSRTFMVWASAFHLSVIVCFFWTLIINALILFQFVEDGTRRTVQFIVGTNIAWVAGVTFMSLDLAMDITGHPHGISAAHFFLTLIFPAIAVLLYLVLVSILVFRKLDEHKPLVYVALALTTFAISQVILFGASAKIAAITRGRVNGSVFSTFFDLVSVALLYRFWHSITDDTWGDWVF